MDKKITSQTDNFPVGRVSDTVTVNSSDIATIFREIDALRMMLTTDGQRTALTRLELSIEKVAGV